jgi:MFS family permease
LLSSACIAFSDVVADGIVVQQTRDSKDPKVAGGLQSLCWGSASAGALLSSYFSGSLLEVMTPRHVFGLTAILPFLVTLIATSINESPVTKDANGNSDIGSVEQQMSDLWSAIKQPNIWKPALFIFLWQSTPTSDGAFLYFMTNDLGMGPEFLGRVRLGLPEVPPYCPHQGYSVLVEHCFLSSWNVVPPSHFTCKPSFGNS